MTELALPVLEPLAWIDAALLGWFALTALSVADVAYDAYFNNPELTVMKWGWVLVTLYIGPLGLGLYILSCKEPRPFTHEEFIKPLWKQAMGSTIHAGPPTAGADGHAVYSREGWQSSRGRARGLLRAAPGALRHLAAQAAQFGLELAQPRLGSSPHLAFGGHRLLGGRACPGLLGQRGGERTIVAQGASRLVVADKLALLDPQPGARRPPSAVAAPRDAQKPGTDADLKSRR